MSNKETKSPYRREAGRIIRAVLASLPPDATWKEKHAALKEAYPFGERRHHPYRMWLTEQTRAIGSRGKPKKGRPEAPGIRFRLAGMAAKPWLSIACGWCDDKMAGGCICCMPLYRRLEFIVTDPRWLAMQRAIAEEQDEAARCAIRDFLQDHGIEYEEISHTQKKAKQ